MNNWATCDQLPTKVFTKRPEETLDQVKRWLASDHCYTIRFAIGILMRLYLDELFDSCFCEWVAATRMPNSEAQPATEDDIYYVDMMEAAALPYLERQGDKALLDEWTRRKAIQKAIESRRIAASMKDYLRTLR